MAGKQGRRGWGFLRRLPSGRFQASYIGPDLVRHHAPRTFTLKMDGERWLSDERRSIERGEWVAPSLRVAQTQAKAITVGEYARAWLEHRTLKHRTRVHYQALLDNQLEPLRKVPLKNLTPDAVRAWHAGLGAQHPAINSHAYGLLHNICGTAVTDGLIPANPCHIRSATKTTRKREPVILTVAEVAQLADTITERFKALVLIAAWCGTRYGETTELRRKDISADAAIITVSRGVTHRQGCRIDTPKSGKSRNVVVPPHIRADIKQHLAKHVGKGPEALLFPAARGGCHLDDKVFRNHFNAALKTVGRQGVTIHSLRHFTGTQTARVGNLVETMQRLGHSTVGASLLYQQIVSGRDAAVAEALSKLASET